MGFFFDSEVEVKKPKGAQLPYELLYEQRCKVCPQKKRWSELESPKMESTGSKRPLVYILGEAPGKNEDLKGRQFVGDSGQFLRCYIPEEFDDRIRWANVLRCRTPENRTPIPIEIECCRGFQLEDIEQTKPLVVIAVGAVPLKWAIPDAVKISSWRGLLVPVQIGSHWCWLYPILHPAFVLRKQSNYEGRKSETELVFQRDLEWLFKKLEEGLDPPEKIIPDVKKDIVLVDRRGDREACELVERTLREYSKEKLVAVDYETQGLRPYRDASLLLTCALHSRHLKTFVFPVEYPDFWERVEYRIRVKKALHDFLLSEGRKVAHSAKFEQEWSLVNVGAEIGSIKWDDTEALAYVADNRRGMLNLDTQTRIHLGFWLKPLSTYPMNMNDMKSVPLTPLLSYNALDVKWLLELRNKLVERLELDLWGNGDQQREVCRERVNTGITLAYVQQKGMPINKSSVKTLMDKFTADVEAEKAKAAKLYGFRQFMKMTGRPPNVDAHKDMEVLFGEILELEECRTESGGITTSDKILSTLEKGDCAEADSILNIRKLQKIIGSFLRPLLHEHIYDDDLVHCVFNHLFVDTGRLSSQFPNMQNMPKRRYKNVRGVFEAPKGYKVVSIDYGAIEARVIAMFSQAEFLVDALWTNYDIHAEWSRNAYKQEAQSFFHLMKTVGEMKPLFKDPKQFKKYRDMIKNKLVFPLFFGSSVKSVGPDCHLTPSGADKVVDDFWDKFKEVKNWHRETTRFYEKNGYVETLYGFRRYEPIGYNQQINTPVQGTAGELVERAGNRLRTKHGIVYNLNVHDDLTFIIKEKYLKRRIECIAKEMVEITHPFINVPLIVEVSVGQNWYEQEEYGVFSSVDFGHKRRGN